jgi:hypothetical protein
MDKIAQAKLDEELAHVIAEATQSRVSITEAIVMIRKMEKAGWVFTNAKLEADMKKADDEKAAAEREKLAAEKPPAPPVRTPPATMPNPVNPVHFENAGPAMYVPPTATQGSIPGALNVSKRAEPIPPMDMDIKHDPDVTKPHSAQIPEKPAEATPKP